jgi:uncharacterized protein
MKKLLTVIALSSIVILSPVHAQTADPKLEWATKAVALQQGPELERLVNQLADSAAQDVLQTWAPKLQANVPKEKIDQARESLNTELKKYFDDVYKSINSKTAKVSTDALIPVYMQKFSLEELKQLVGFFESPVVKKYQATAPELGNVFVQQLIEATRADVVARGKQFDDAATKIVGSAPAAAPTGKSKPVPKK